jgi:hypothetical protein
MRLIEALNRINDEIDRQITGRTAGAAALSSSTHREVSAASANRRVGIDPAIIIDPLTGAMVCHSIAMRCHRILPGQAGKR